MEATMKWQKTEIKWKLCFNENWKVYFIQIRYTRYLSNRMLAWFFNATVATFKCLYREVCCSIHAIQATTVGNGTFLSVDRSEGNPSHPSKFNTI